jgi:hypothetical protein
VTDQYQIDMKDIPKLKRFPIEGIDFVFVNMHKVVALMVLLDQLKAKVQFLI